MHIMIMITSMHCSSLFSCNSAIVADDTYSEKSHLSELLASLRCTLNRSPVRVPAASITDGSQGLYSLYYIWGGGK